MALLLWILIFSLIAGVLSVLAAAGFLLLRTEVRAYILPYAVSFAVGALLGVAFLALLPHALESAGMAQTHTLSSTVMLGIVLFYVLERVLHRHNKEVNTLAGTAHALHTQEKRAAGLVVLVGDALHNFVDGVLIAAAFMTDIHLGIVTALAVAAHEIPQELGNFAILLHSGYARGEVFVYNVLSSLSTVAGAVGAYFGLAGLQGVLPFILALAAANFIYVATATLLPGLQRNGKPTLFQQIALIILGAGVIYVAHRAAHG